MTRPGDKNANPPEKLRSGVLKYERPTEPATEEGEWGSFFNATERVDESFTRGEQGVTREREVDWDDVFGNMHSHREGA